MISQKIIVGIIVAVAWVLFMLRVYYRIKSAGNSEDSCSGCCSSDTCSRSKKEDKNDCGCGCS